MDETTPTVQESTEPQEIVSELLTELPDEVSFRTATLQERFAAFFTDSLILFYLIGGWAFVLKYFFKEDLTQPFSFRGTGRILFLTTSAAFVFLYHILSEGVLLATPGKFLGGLSLQKKDGGTPSLFAILVRNLLRLVDYPLFFLTGVGLIEATSRGQRLGDLLAGTVVVREISFEGRRIHPDQAQPAGATRRTLAFLLDLGLVIPFFYGLLLMIPAERPILSLIGLNLVPTLTIAFLALSESLFQTTVGKVLLGMKVVQEDGRPARFSALLVRNAFRLFDTNPIGYLCAVLSSRKQRPGDIAAGTWVVKSRRGLRGWFSLPSMLFLAATVATLGYLNPASFLKRGLRVEAGSFRFHPIPMSLKRLTLRHLYVEQLEFGFNEEEVNRRGVYEAGEIIYLLFTISGYTVRNERAWIQADIRVRDSHRNVVLDRLNIVNASLPVGGRKSARLATRFALHPSASPGPYEVTLTLRDLFGNTRLEEKKTFTVRP